MGVQNEALRKALKGKESRSMPKVFWEKHKGQKMIATQENIEKLKFAVTLCKIVGKQNTNIPKYEKLLKAMIKGCNDKEQKKELKKVLNVLKG